MFSREMVVGFKRGKNLAKEKVDSALRLGGNKPTSKVTIENA
jgi:hypothetical protein